MRLSVFGVGLVVLALAACAPSGPSAVSRESKSPAQAVVLTARPVPATDTRVADLLHTGAMRPDAAATEYVVRTADGTTLAIVQAADPALRPGVAVTVRRDERAVLAAR